MMNNGIYGKITIISNGKPKAKTFADPVHLAVHGRCAVITTTTRQRSYADFKLKSDFAKHRTHGTSNGQSFISSRIKLKLNFLFGLWITDCIHN